jgi:shikimate kinase / 3-dehydroquinate synthase
MRNLVLTGFMGVGKTAVGKAVARRLERDFLDMDAEIESRAGKTIARIFETGGEGAFRTMEAALCRELADQTDFVIATGGGALLDPENRAALMATSNVVCLNAGVDEILARVGASSSSGSQEAGVRPLLDVPDPRAVVERLLTARVSAYALIPWQVRTDGRSIDKIAAEVAALSTAYSLPVTCAGTGAGDRYWIHIGEGTLRYLGGALRAATRPAPDASPLRVAVVADDTVAPLYAAPAMASLKDAGFAPVLCQIPSGEVHKTLATVRALYDQFLAHDLDRRSLVLALGGGVTGDVAGFAAATYMRGVRFVQVPTTLLAMTDASVGGKTGVDLSQGKNLVGAFKQPEVVFIDLQVLETLAPEEYRSGLAEVLKHGVIGDPGLFRALAEGERMTPALLARSIQVKIGIVEMDPFEQGRRAVLNLGHTTGHALERLSDFQMRHGEGVAIGTVAAARIAAALGIADAGLATEIAAALAALGLPTVCPAVDGRPRHTAAEIIGAMRHDKKRRGKRLRWILPTAIGAVTIVDDVPDAVVHNVLVALGAAS